MKLNTTSRGREVQRLQLLFTTRGVPLVPDGIFGVRTRQAVAQEQARAHLPVTGKADDQLLALLLAEPVVTVQVPRLQTVLSLDERRAALRAGRLGPLSVNAERMALAQLQIEHGADALWTHNFGNVMRRKHESGPWFAMDALERHSYGWENHHSSWCAYATPEEGAAGYWTLLERCTS